MMKRIVAALFLLVLLLVALAVIAPGFIDWNKHKDIIITRLEAAIERDITVAGDVSFRILPNPQILMQDVSIAAVKGAKNPHVLTLKQMEGKVRLKPLLEGRLEVESFHLTAPELTLEVLEDGQTSWGMTGARTAPGGSAFTAIELQNVSITDGKIRYLRHDSGADIVLDHLNVSLTAQQWQGPYTVKGDLRYHDIPVNVELATQGKNNTGLYPVKLLLQPVDVLPQFRFVGLMGLAQGLVLDGDIELEGGSLGSLFKDDFANAAGFMQQAAQIKGALSFKDQKLDLKISEGTWDGKGKLEGTITAAFSSAEKTRVTADLAGTTLMLADKSGSYLPVPAGYDIAAKLKFLDVTWQGARFPGLTLDVKTQNDEWLVADTRLDLNARGGMQFSGTVTPKQEMASWNVSLNTSDMGTAFAHLSAKNMPLLQALADKSLSIPLSLKGNLDQRQNRISLYNFTARSGEDHAVSGVLNLRTDGMMEARLSVPRITLDRLPNAAMQSFMQQLPKQILDAEVTADMLVRGKTVMKNIKLKAAGDGQKMSIENLSGQTGDDAPFDLKGSFTAWPIGQGDFDLSYHLKTADAAAFTDMLGAPMPPPLQNARRLDVTGAWRQDRVAQTLTAQGDYQGGTIDMTSVLPRGMETPLWKSDVDMKLPESGLLFSTFGLPHDRLLLPAAAVAFKGTVEGGHIQGTATAAQHKLAVDIQMTADGHSAAAVKSNRVDLNKWFSETPTVQADTDITLDAEKVLWRDLTLENVTADTGMTTSAFEVRKLSGQLWGGALDVSATAKRETKKWQGRVTGKVKNADLAPLLTATGIKGMAAGRGDIVFDLEGPGDAKGLQGATGTVSLTIDSLTLDAFDPAALADFIRAQKSLPDDLATRLHKAMRENGGSTFNDVSVDLTLADGKAEIASLSLGNADVNMQVSGTFDTATESYDIKAETNLKNLPEVGSLSITRKGAAADAPDYLFDIVGIKAWIETRLPPPEPEEVMPVITDDPNAMPDAPTIDVESMPLDAPPASEDDVMPPADDSVEIEKLLPPDVPEADSGAETRDTLQGILDRLEEAPVVPEDEILPPE